MSEFLENKLKLYIKNFELLDELKRKTMKETRMFIALLYAIRDRKVNMNNLIEISDKIKEDKKMLSSLGNDQRFSLASIIESRFEEPLDIFEELNNDIEKIINVGFKKSPYLNIAAISLIGDDRVDERVAKASEIFKGMKKSHRFLTGRDDYPLAILLSESSRDVRELIKDMEYYYNSLYKSLFKKSNELQLLSHILTFTNRRIREEAVEKCNEVYRTFKAGGLKTYGLNYSQIGLISLLDMDYLELAKIIKEKTNYVNEYKEFKHTKLTNQIIVSLLAAYSSLEGSRETDLLESNIVIAIENLIQQVISATIAISAATSVSTTSASSGS